MTDRDTIALVSMGCCWFGREDLDAYWYRLVNDLPMEPDCLSSNSAQPLSRQIADVVEEIRADLNLEKIRPTEFVMIMAGSFLGDPSFASSVTGQNSITVDDVWQALDQARDLLQNKKNKLVMILAVEPGEKVSPNDARQMFTPYGADSVYVHAISPGVACIALARVDVATERDWKSYALLSEAAGSNQIEQALLSSPDMLETLRQCDMIEGAGRGDLESDGDEISVLHRLLGDYDPALPLQALGSVKAFVGNTGCVAPLASIIKSALSLSNKVIPGNGCDYEPMASLYQTPLFLNQRLRPWIHHPGKGPRQAFVLDASNPDKNGGWALLREVPHEQSRPFTLKLHNESELILITAPTVTCLRQRLNQLLHCVESQAQASVTLAHIAYSCSLQINHDDGVRAALIIKEIPQLIALGRCLDEYLFSGVGKLPKEVSFSAHASQPHGAVGALFPGQGYPGLMGNFADHLYMHALRFPTIREVFDISDDRTPNNEDQVPFNHLIFPPSGRPETERKRYRARVSAPIIADAQTCQHPLDHKISMFALSAANYATWKLMQQAGFYADAVYGQSLGELSAICAAGGVDYKELLELLRGEPEFDVSYYATGRMMVCVGPREEAERFVTQYPSIEIAIHASPTVHLMAGDKEEVERAVNEYAGEALAHILPYPAIHTQKMRGLRAAAEPTFEGIHIYPLKIQVYSGIMSIPYEKPYDPAYVRDRMVSNYNNPVLSWQTQTRMYEDGIRLFVQMGGGSTMHSMTETVVESDNLFATSFDSEYRSGLEQLQHMFAGLFTRGVNLDPMFLYEGRQKREAFLVKELDWSRNESQLEDFSIQMDWGDTMLTYDRVNQLPCGPAVDQMPFMGDFLHFVPETELVMKRMLDLATDWHLADHTFIPVKQVKPLVYCGPVMPLTMTMELMAEVASLLAPERGLTGFENIKAYKWLGVEKKQSEEMTVEARVTHDDPATGQRWINVKVKLGDKQNLVTEATVRFGVDYQVTIEPDLSDLGEPKAFPMSVEDIYGCGFLFHGSRYQALTALPAVMEQGIVGELEVLPKDHFFSFTSTPHMLTDPVLLDALGQVLGSWGLLHARYIMPVSIDAIDIYGPTPPVGTRVPVVVKITDVTVKSVSSNMEVQDGNGNVWMRIQKWSDWSFVWPKRYYQVRRLPWKYLYGDVIHSGIPTGATVVDVPELDQYPQYVQDSIAQTYLTTDEYEHYESLAKNHSRQIEWLAGRIGAKDAVRAHLLPEGATEYEQPAGYGLDHDQHGQPYITQANFDAPYVSLAHKGSRAVAVAAHQPVGIDMEWVESRSEEFISTMCLAEEIAQLGHIHHDRDTAVTILWCAKEAAGKAMGIGLHPSVRSFVLKRNETDQRLLMVQRETNRSFEVFWSLGEEGSVMAVTMLEAGAENVGGPMLRDNTDDDNERYRTGS